MTGTWMRRYTPHFAPGPLHRCEPPMRPSHPGSVVERADGDHGFLWRCECGKLWEVCEFPLHGDVNYRTPYPFWRKAGLLTRIQYRRGRR